MHDVDDRDRSPPSVSTAKRGLGVGAVANADIDPDAEQDGQDRRPTRSTARPWPLRPGRGVVIASRRARSAASSSAGSGVSSITSQLLMPHAVGVPGAAAGPDAWRRRASCAAAKRPPERNTSVATVASSRPPITARPSGAFCSPPSPRPSAIGTMPMIIASAVISTGRKRVKPASIAARVGVAMLGQPLAGERHHQDAVGGGDAHAHDGAHQRRHAERGPGEEQEQHDACQRRRQAP